ncbi:hypothetical protein ABRP17_007115 [Stenotrophomonas sp. WHRI 8082]|uniref:hypothetical protein n=1 Tax=Stenotrophomonas sp. WHRI 8082 TaxID=3162571 RepID=UPI0032EEB7BA
MEYLSRTLVAAELKNKVVSDFRSIVVGLVFAFPATMTGASESEISEGTFAMMAGGKCDLPNSSDCYLKDPAKAGVVIDNLASAGVTRFLVPSTELSELRMLGGLIRERGLTFYTYERWSFEASLIDNEFSCTAFSENRISKVLEPLRQEFGSTFAGLHFKDEPPETQVEALGKLTDCVRKDRRLAGIKIIVNLLPIHANAASYAGTQHAGAMSPIEYGVDCRLGQISDPEKTASMVGKYSAYAQSISDVVRPDYLAFDIYPFVRSLVSCPAAQRLLLAENMSIVTNLGRSRGQVPVAYLQNVRSLGGASGPDPFQYASFHELRWFAGWFNVFGGSTFANFVSHDLRTNVTDVQPHTQGLLAADNSPTPLLSDQASTYGVTRQLYKALNGVSHIGFVDSELGVNKGKLAGWISSGDFIVGEYANADQSSSRLVVASRNPRQSVRGLIGLNSWWTKVEQLDYETGLWSVVGNSTNAIDVNISVDPVIIYRLTR